jgi:ERF superfamily
MTALAVDKAVNAVKLAMAEEGVAKGRTTSAQGRYPYRGVDDIVDAVAIHMASAGLNIYQRTIEHRIEEHKSSTGGVLFYCYVKCEFEFAAVEDGSTRITQFIGESFDSGDKSTGKAETYAYRNCLSKTFVIPVNGSDADSDKHESPPVAPRQPPPAQQQTRRAPDYSKVWYLYANSSVVGQPVVNIPAEKLASYIQKLEASLKSKDTEIAETASGFYRAALAEHDRRAKLEGSKS